MEQKRNKIHRRDLLFDLLLSQIRADRIDPALKTLKQYLELSNKDNLDIPEGLKTVDTFKSWLKKRKTSTRSALLVGVNGPNTHTAHLDIEAWQKCLVDHMGYQPAHIKTLVGADARREEILKAYKVLVNLSIICPTTFIYAGTGSVRAGEPTQYGLLAYDSINDQDGTCQEISLQNLADASIKAKTLSVILDTGWSLLHDRAYGIGGYFEEDTLDHIPLVGTSMMTSAFSSSKNSMKQLICKENDHGSLFSQQLIRQIETKGSGHSFRKYRDLITQASSSENYQTSY